MADIFAIPAATDMPAPKLSPPPRIAIQVRSHCEATFDLPTSSSTSRHDYTPIRHEPIDRRHPTSIALAPDL